MPKFLMIILLFSVQSIHAQNQQFTGTWTKVNTTYVFEFDLIIHNRGSNQVEGYFNWKVVEYDENNLFSRAHYKDKIGLKAREFVRGTYNPKSKEYHLKGFKKEDPHNIIGMDTYHSKLDKDGNIGGNTNANGSWLGRINGEGLKMEIL